MIVNVADAISLKSVGGTTDHACCKLSLKWSNCPCPHAGGSKRSFECVSPEVWESSEVGSITNLMYTLIKSERVGSVVEDDGDMVQNGSTKVMVNDRQCGR